MWLFDLKTKSWAWISGSSEIDGDGYYGIQGLSSDLTIPGSRMAHGMDFDPSARRIYVFGGFRNIGNSSSKLEGKSFSLVVIF